MKVLLLNGRTRKNGCTYLALSEVAKTLNAEGVETEIIQMGGAPIWDCIGCNGCAGTTASLDVLNKYLLNAEMPIVSSTYWSMVFAPAPELVEQDKEGLQTMRNLGRNMAWLLGCIEAGQQQGRTPPQAERAHWTSFNR